MFNGFLPWLTDDSPSWDADPCLTCGEKVTGLTAMSGIYGFKTTVQPCGHGVVAVKINHMDTPHPHLAFKKAEPEPELVEPLFLGHVYQDLILEYQKKSATAIFNYLPTTYGGMVHPLSPSSGMGLPQGLTIYAHLLQSCPSLGSHVAQCPECPDSTWRTPLGNLIPHLNDKHKWSREKIADWLETLDVDLTIQRVKEPV